MPAWWRPPTKRWLMAGEASRVPLTVFQILLIGASVVLFILAAVNTKTNEQRFRYVAAGLACWVVYVLLQMIGGLVK